LRDASVLIERLSNLVGLDVSIALTCLAFLLAVLAVFAAGTVAGVTLCSSVSVASRALHSVAVEESCRLFGGGDGIGGEMDGVGRRQTKECRSVWKRFVVCFQSRKYSVRVSKKQSPERVQPSWIGEA
jgi:hypothetical protein